MNISWRNKGAFPARLSWLSLACACACDTDQSAPTTARDLIPLHVEYTGCSRVDQGPVCVREKAGELRIWVEGPVDDATELRIDDAQAAWQLEEAEGGRHQALALPLDAQAIELRRPNASPWSLALAQAHAPTWLEAAEKLGAAEKATLLGTEQAKVRPEERGRLLYELARAQRNLGETEQARDSLQRAIELQGQHGRQSGQLTSALLLVYNLAENGQRAEARRVLEQAPAPPEGHQDSLFNAGFIEGVVRSWSGDHRAAITQFEEALALARRMGSQENELFALSALADSLQLSGRHEAAGLLLTEPLFGPRALEDPCERAIRQNNYGWWLLEAQEADLDLGQVGSPELRTLGLDPIPHLHEALSLAKEHCPPSDHPHRLGNIRINLALAHIQADRPDEAEQHLDQADAIFPAKNQREQHVATDCRGRIALQRHEAAQALATFQQLETSARSAGSIEFEWKALFGQAIALEALARPEDALQAWERGQVLLYEHSFLVPIHIGRDDFLAQRQRATQRHVALLLQLQRPAQAMALLRGARSRFLASLQQAQRVQGLSPEERRQWEQRLDDYTGVRERLLGMYKQQWQASAGELERLRREQQRLAHQAHQVLDRGLSQGSSASLEPRPPDQGEALLAFFPLEEGWLGLLQDGQGVLVHELGPLDPQRPETMHGQTLLAPFAARLALAQRVTLLPAGELRPIDLHQLELDGQPLASRLPVVYALDLARPAASPANELQRAVVVADPRGDLGHAREEGATVNLRLQKQGIAVHTLLGEQASRQALLEALAGADLLHYAGHGVYSEQVLDGELALAGESSLTVADILALADPPSVVLLSGCETARAKDSAIESLGLAQAFVTAGSQLVLATSRPVDDTLAAAFAQGFYEALAQERDPLRACHLALRAGSARSPQADWGAFRVLVP